MQQKHNPDFDSLGFFVANDILSEKRSYELETSLPDTDSAGTRALLEIECFKKFSQELMGRPSITGVLSGLTAIQGIYFRKTCDHNWSVQLHRDKIIPASGTGPWKSAGIKDGFSSVHAPEDFMAECVAIRVALDDCEDGDLRVVPGSHLNQTNVVADHAETVKVSKGHALVLRPNLLHASSKLVISPSRRVLHFLFAPTKPPHGYTWPYTGHQTDAIGSS